MPLTTGSHIGAYRILGPLGAGGIGGVYRARDPGSSGKWPSRSFPATWQRIRSEPDIWIVERK